MTTPQTRNITRAFRECVATDAWSFHEGMIWYAVRRQESEKLDPDNPARAAAIIAVLSPRLEWSLNLQMAKSVYAGRPARGLGANIAKAHAIYSGAVPESVVKGPKVTSFWRNIVSPDDATPVTVDRHAIDIACGKAQSDSERSLALRANGYLDIAEMYRRAAKILSKEYGQTILPQQVQAVTWIWWRKNKTAKRKAKV